MLVPATDASLARCQATYRASGARKDFWTARWGQTLDIISVFYVKKTMWFPNMQGKVEETYLIGEMNKFMKSKRKYTKVNCDKLKMS